MGVQENIRLIKARYKAVNAHDWDKFQGFYSESIVWRDPGRATPIRGAGAVRRRLEGLTTAFPDLQWRLDRIFSQGQAVCAEFTFTGTHQGTLALPRGKQKLAPTNQSIRLQACGVYIVRRGKIVDSKIYFDLDTLLAQTRGSRKSV